jgi:tetratricopeptide (TPR) repeat protein
MNSAVLGKSHAHMGLGNYKEAIPYFDKALEIDRSNKYALNAKGFTLGGVGNYIEAIEYFDKALAIDPHYELALYNKGVTLDSLGNYTQAKQSFDKALVQVAHSHSRPINSNLYFLLFQQAFHMLPFLT